MAIGAQNYDLVELLLRSGAVVNQVGAHGETPLHLAAMGGDNKLVRKILLAGGDVNAQLVKGATPLHCACQNGDSSKIVKALLKKECHLQLTRCKGL